MLTWLWNFFIGNLCKHDWEDKEYINLYTSSYATRPIAAVIRQRCTKCKNWRKIRMDN